ncbi:zinc finger protein 540-like isoform X2 [Varroa jacobsoni]|uniref:zinc finger protein 540-like isoform X2 n=1 Tax=Varroa jacobsoni TaxID=62625 RepID=UPI000BF5F8E9|nr:zinc finger protein 540-like isoform X2 [Varroa jacobsoni]
MVVRVCIDAQHSPFVTSLAFPQGIAPGENIELYIGTWDLPESPPPKANTIVVDPLTKVVHVARKLDTVGKRKAAGADPSGPEGARKKLLLSQKGLRPGMNSLAGHAGKPGTGNSTNSVGMGRNKCGECGQVFDSIKEISLHMQRHLAEKVPHEKNSVVTLTHRPKDGSLPSKATITQDPNCRNRVEVSIPLAAAETFLQTVLDQAQQILLKHTRPTAGGTLEVRKTDRYKEGDTNRSIILEALEQESEGFREKSIMPSKYHNMTDTQLAQIELFYTKSLYERGLIELRSEVQQCQQLVVPAMGGHEEKKEFLDVLDLRDKAVVVEANQENDCHTLAPDHSDESGATDDETLDIENQEHSDLTVPQCHRCSRSFLDPATFASHVAQCRVHCRQPCPNCGLPFASRLQRDRHMREAHGLASVWPCPHCDAGHFYTEKGRDYHIYKLHSTTLSETNRIKLVEKYAQPCGMCDFVSWSKKTLQVHRRSEHFAVEWSIHCPACACGMKDREDLERHVEQKHAQDPNWYICLSCLRAISRLGDDGAAAIAHRSLHEQNNGELCQQCGKLFENADSLTFHQLKAHQGPLKDHHCGVCDLPQRDYRHLVFHMNAHHKRGTSPSLDDPSTENHITRGAHCSGTIGTSSKRPSSFICRDCNRSYEAKSQLIAHQVWVHQRCEDDRYPCPFCGKPFTKQSYLALHLRRHVDERPYRCEHCGKSFAHLASLKGHVTMKHTKDFRFRCPICDKGFVSRVKTLHHLEQAHHYSAVAARMAMGEGQEQDGKNAVFDEIEVEHSFDEPKATLDDNDIPLTKATAQFLEEENGSYSDFRTITAERHDEIRKENQCFPRSSLQHYGRRPENVLNHFIEQVGRDQDKAHEFMATKETSTDTVPSSAIVSFEDGPENCRNDVGPNGPVEISERGKDVNTPSGGEVILNHADGSQSLVRLQPGQQLLLEDENGVKQVIDYNDVVASAATHVCSHGPQVGGTIESVNARFPVSVHVQSDNPQ